MITKDLGIVTAYGYAVSKGYTGTEEEFAELMASYATVAEEAAQSASTASEKAQQAAQAVLDAVSAKDATVQAKNDAETAKTSAQQFATSAGNSASAASGSAISASQSASSANSSAESASASAQSASQSAEDANTAKTDAQTAKTDAETAQSKAEEAQAKAEEAADDLSAEVEQIETNKNDIAELRSSVGSVVANTASGDIASFTDGADDYPVKDLVAHIDPVQDLHGYANPWPGGGGVNKCSPFTRDDYGGTFSADGLTVTTGTRTDNNLIRCVLTETIPVVLDATYYVSFDARLISGSCTNFGSLALTDSSGTTLFNWRTAVAYPTLTSKKQRYKYYATGNRDGIGAKLYIQGANTDNAVVEISNVCISLTENYDYEPYSNICPITGWTEANVTRTGKNLLPYPYANGDSFTTRGVTFTVNSDHSVTVNGTPSGGSAFFNFKDRADCFTLKPGTYTVNKTGQTGFSFAVYAIHSDGTEANLGTAAIADRTFTLEEETRVFTYLSVTNGTTVDKTFYPQLELGSTATDYEPYNGDTYAVTFPTEAGTVYGGTLDVTTGVLTVDKASVDLGTLTWIYSPTATFPYFRSNELLTMKPSTGNTILQPITCSKYPNGTWTNVIDTSGYDKHICIGLGGRSYIAIKDSSFTTIEDFNTSINGVQFVYELATPITYQLTPTEVKTLLGANNIFADTGAVDVEYCADTKKYIDNAIATAIAAL